MCPTLQQPCLGGSLSSYSFICHLTCPTFPKCLFSTAPVGHPHGPMDQTEAPRPGIHGSLQPALFPTTCALHGNTSSLFPVLSHPAPIHSNGPLRFMQYSRVRAHSSFLCPRRTRTCRHTHTHTHVNNGNGWILQELRRGRHQCTCERRVERGNRPESGGKPQRSEHWSQARKNEEKGETALETKEGAWGHMARGRSQGAGRWGRGRAAQAGPHPVLCR